MYISHHTSLQPLLRLCVLILDGDSAGFQELLDSDILNPLDLSAEFVSNLRGCELVRHPVSAEGGSILLAEFPIEQMPVKHKNLQLVDGDNGLIADF
jgi:hypothetical protein